MVDSKFLARGWRGWSHSPLRRYGKVVAEISTRNAPIRKVPDFVQQINRVGLRHTDMIFRGELRCRGHDVEYVHVGVCHRIANLPPKWGMRKSPEIMVGALSGTWYTHATFGHTLFVVNRCRALFEGEGWGRGIECGRRACAKNAQHHRTNFAGQITSSVSFPKRHERDRRTS